MKDTLIFPAGIRFVEPDELPRGPHKNELLEKIGSARIEPGYLIRNADNPLFDYYAEVNVHAPRIWTVFRSLCEALLPESLCSNTVIERRGC